MLSPAHFVIPLLMVVKVTTHVNYRARRPCYLVDRLWHVHGKKNATNSPAEDHLTAQIVVVTRHQQQHVLPIVSVDGLWQ